MRERKTLTEGVGENEREEGASEVSMVTVALSWIASAIKWERMLKWEQLLHEHSFTQSHQETTWEVLSISSPICSTCQYSFLIQMPYYVTFHLCLPRSFFWIWSRKLSICQSHYLNIRCCIAIERTRIMHFCRPTQIFASPWFPQQKAKKMILPMAFGLCRK